MLRYGSHSLVAVGSRISRHQWVA